MLDGSKTGLTVLPSVLAMDTLKYQKRPPVWKENMDDKSIVRAQEGNEANTTRPSHLGPSIMDLLHRIASLECDRQLQAVEAKFENPEQSGVDTDLATPWWTAVALSERFLAETGSSRMQDDLRHISEHIQRCYIEHRASVSTVTTSTGSRAQPSKTSFTNLTIQKRQDTLRAISHKFASAPSPSEVLLPEEQLRCLKASYAYLLDYQERATHWTRFPWDMAFRELCLIKCRAKGNFKAITNDFYQQFSMKKPGLTH